jgi:hypothetical protein
MTDAQIENLIKLAGEATPGPWRHVVHGMHDIVEFKSCYYSDSLNSQEAEHIAACSPEVITELCTKLKKYRKALESIMAFQYYPDGTLMNDSDANIAQVKIARAALLEKENENG